MNKFGAILLLSIFIFTNNITQAQVWRQYEWEYYNIKFELPDNFKVTVNTEDALKASGVGIDFELYPISDANFNEANLAGFIVNLAEDELNLSEINEMELVEIDGMNGGFVAGTKDELMYLVLGLIDSETNNSFYALVSFDPEQEEVIEDALEVFASFGKMQ